MHINLFSIYKPVIIAASIVCLGTVAQAAETAKPAVQAAAATVLPDPVAKVNGVSISAAEYQRAQKVILNGQTLDKVPAERRKDLQDHIITQLTSAELLYQGAQKLEIKDLDSQIEAKMSQGKKRFKSEQEFEKAIKEMNITPAELKEYTRRDVLISNFIQSTIVSKIKVSEDEIKKFYDQNIDKFKKDETVKASHILIGIDSKSTDADKKKAREKAEKLRKEIAGGADFNELAKGNSTCPSSQQGGDLGYFGKGQMVPEFEKAAFSMKKGDVSDVVETKFGFHIIKVTDKKSAETIELKDAKPRLEDFLKGQKVNAAVNEYLADARKKAKIEVLVK
jgi:peptidyl-prolyl cis-trans isomerase C